MRRKIKEYQNKWKDPKDTKPDYHGNFGTTNLENIETEEDEYSHGFINGT